MNGNDASVAMPQSVADVEELVKRLYKPGSPKVISTINDKLLKLQHSTEGWNLADALMSSNDQNVRFFAANTFTVKLNNEGSNLDAEAAQTIRKRLTSWLAHAVSQHNSAMVVRKLCATLVTYYIRLSFLWDRPICTIAHTLHTGNEDADHLPGIDSTLPRLNQYQVVALLWFSATLADEVSRLDSNTASHSKVHNAMEVNVQDASRIMGAALKAPDFKVNGEGLRCFLTWVNYAQPVWPRNLKALQHLRELVEPATRSLVTQEVQNDALEVFRDILESYTSFFQPDHMRLIGRIVREHVQPVLQQALHDQIPEVLPYGQMVIAYGVANVEEVAERLDASEHAVTIVNLHFDILRAPGYPGDDDELSIMSIEFWNTYVEYVNDTVFSQDPGQPEPTWLPSAKAILLQLMEILWAKMVTPPGNVANNWTDDESDGFKEFRLDTTDLILSMYVCLGKEMLQKLVALALQSLENKQWRPLEAGLFCLNALADNVLEEQAGEDTLAAVFGSSLFREMGDFSQTIPSQARRTAIDILGSYGNYIERHVEYLADAVRFLFASLEMGLLANTAAKSIAALCSACRSSLTGELDGFLQQYQSFLAGPTNDPYTKEKVIGGIACIVQALKPESAKVAPLLSLIGNIERDVQQAKDNAASNREMCAVMGVAALSCLAAIGTSLQVPDDVTIDLYDDDEPAQGQRNYWEGEEAEVVQHRIMGCFSVLQVLGNDGDAIEAACQVLKSGFAESEPGPFVLPPSVTVSFLQQCTIQTPQVESVLSTACILITQHSKPTSKRIPEEIRAICQQVAHFVDQLQRPNRDPGIAHGCIEVLTRLFPHYMYLLLEHNSALAEQLSAILDFTLQAIDGQDPFPKRSAAELWAKLIKPPNVSMSDDARHRLAQVISAYGPQLSLTLVRQIGGFASRSELDYICEPLKALVVNQAASRGWLEAAVLNKAFVTESGSVGDTEKRRFLLQIFGLRGEMRKTKEVVKEFWAACRGTVVSFS
ncbi:member of the karyopherin-beta [Recurvomyces mirabilis]|nr:member of the karyopherin-beta [Recurvomyces mirabilis]